MMRNKTIVIALGGNAIIKKGEEGDIHQQFANTRASLAGIISLLKHHNKVVITHGNGPIVGNILIRVDEGAKKGIPKMPLGICVADSQGGIGYMLQQCLQNRLIKEGIKRCVATIITQVLVDKDDPCIKNPTKPVGPFYSKKEAEEHKKENPGWTIKEDSGRGFRRMVPSPFPLDVVEKRSIKKILENGFIVIAAGGGGIPVYLDKDGLYEGFDAVIDKDLSSYVMGREIRADTLIMLSNVEGAYLDYNTPRQKLLRKVGLDEMKRHHKDGQFPAGSMGPKVHAAILFLESGGSSVLITCVDRFIDALAGKTGTWITP